MFKTGIYKKEQLTPAQLYSKAGMRKFVALDLYEAYEGTPEERERFQEQAIGRLAMANGSFKKTHKNRFNEFDKKAISFIGETFPDDQPLRVHDLAVSDGRTSVPFFKVLALSYKLNLEFLATDYAAEFISLRKKNTQARVIMDKKGNLVQTILPPFVFNAVWPEHFLFYPVNTAIRLTAGRAMANAIQREAQKNPQGVDKKEILVLCQECKALMSDPRFTFRPYDLLAGPLGTQHVIRAMNILNESYFPPTQMKQAVDNIADSLAQGGILITGSNDDSGSKVNGGVYKKINNSFEVLYESGEGSPARRYLLPAQG